MVDVAVRADSAVPLYVCLRYEGGTNNHHDFCLSGRGRIPAITSSEPESQDVYPCEFCLPEIISYLPIQP
jgi:hypothetical protein